MKQNDKLSGDLESLALVLAKEVGRENSDGWTVYRALKRLAMRGALGSLYYQAEEVNLATWPWWHRNTRHIYVTIARDAARELIRSELALMRKEGVL